MKRVLVLGGYGGFGSGVSERLRRDGFEVWVAGRSLERAEAFCEGRPGLVPIAVDRDRTLAAALEAHRPWAVVDAAGPFQGLDYRVPRACMAAGVHYLDLADAREFVIGIDALDADARAAGVAVVSGASSVPALSGAVMRRLAAGLSRVSSVELAISASNRATVGPSVAAAILSYVGRPFRIWRGRRWDTGHGWAEMRAVEFSVPGRPRLRRLVGLADVPDLQLLPDRLPGRPAVVFWAGTELGVHNRALQLAGWMVRRGWLRTLEPLRRRLPALRRLTAGLGSDRSAMAARVQGEAEGRRVDRTWTLLAENGDGPQIPCLAAPLLLRRLADGGLEPGARDAGSLLELEAFAPALAELSVRTASTETQPPPPLYQRVMGESFDELAPGVRAMHSAPADGAAAGEATVERGTHPLARLAAWLFGFPPAAARVPVHVRFEERGGREVWTRDFGGARFRSELGERDGRLVERFGPLRFAFDLPVEDGGLRMVLRRWWAGPLPLPRALGPGGVAREWEAEGRFHFDVPITLPGAGLVVRYTGWLEPLP